MTVSAYALFASARMSAIALDEDYRRERQLEDEENERLAAKAAAELSDDERRAIAEEELRLLRSEERPVVERVACPECGAARGEFCHGLEASSHYGRAAAYART